MRKIIRRILKYVIFTPVLLIISPLMILTVWAFDEDYTFKGAIKSVLSDALNDTL